MNVSGLLFLILAVHCECLLNSTENYCLNVKTDIGSVRKRRHLTFPDESAVVLTISLVKAFMTHAPSGWNIALEIDVIYPLPKEEVINRFYRKKLHHKQKRELWVKMQHALDLYNINGHSCILRGICEWKSSHVPPGKSLVYDLLRVVFTASDQDETFIEEMKGYYDFSDPNFCKRINDCPFSLVDFILNLSKQ